MKTTKTITVFGAICLCSLAGCATKGAKTVTALPFVVPERTSPTDWAVQDAPRTSPGRIMDPEAVTYAQVPSRIIYLPESKGIFGRTSSRQEVAYNLIPVDRIGEVQARGTPIFEEKKPTEAKSSPERQIWNAAFTEADGTISKGVARRLGVIGKTDGEKLRAEALLQRDENLRWVEESGWVGFTLERTEGKPLEKTPEIKIPPLPELPHGTPPEELETISGAKKDQKLPDLNMETPEGNNKANEKASEKPSGIPEITIE